MLRLTEKDLDDFADYMKSGEMEQDFRDGCEHDRLFLLSLLEKFMDVADLADETATKLVFRGNLGRFWGTLSDSPAFLHRHRIFSPSLLRKGLFLSPAKKNFISLKLPFLPLFRSFERNNNKYITISVC